MAVNLGGQGGEENRPISMVETLLSNPTTAPSIRSALASEPSLNLADILRGSAGAIRPLLDELAPEPAEMDPRQAARLRVSMIFGALAGQRPHETAAARILAEDRARRDEASQRRAALAQSFIGEQIRGTIQAAGESAREETRFALEERKGKAALERLKIQEAGRLQRATIRGGRVGAAEILAGLAGEKERKQFIESNLQMIDARARAQEGAVGAFEKEEGTRTFFRIRSSKLSMLGRETGEVQDRLNEIEALVQSGESTYIDPRTFEEKPISALLPERSLLTNYLEKLAAEEDKVREEIEQGPRRAKPGRGVPSGEPVRDEEADFRAFRATLTPERMAQWDTYSPEEKRYVLRRLRANQ